MSLQDNVFLELPTPDADFLAGGGRMAAVIASIDWSRTPLGPFATWPQSLRTTVSLCLASNFPISIAWGPECIQIYNDGYWPICGAKHPHSMGQDFRLCWRSAWPAIGEAFERAQAGQTSYLENQRMFLDRNGYLEETFFTFSFSPIRDESGGVGGLFHPVTETTSKMLSERRTRALRDLAAVTTKAETVEEACQLAATVLADYALDLPFVLLYLCGEEQKQARLVGASGLEPGTSASPAVVSLAGQAEEAAPGWPFDQVIRSSQPVLAADLERRFGPLSCGPYPESPRSAFVLPIPRPGSDRLAGFLVAGVSTRRALDDSYSGFYDLLAGHVATSLANARAYEEERKRAEALAEIDRAKTAFFSNVSHEFRTPLTLMLGPVEELLSQPQDKVLPENRRLIELVHRNGLRLQKLVNTLLDFSRIEAGRVQAVYEPADLAALTKELASNFRSAFQKAGLELFVDCPALPDSVYVDREMWEKIVLNLLSNAFKFTFEGSVTISLHPCGEGVELSVEDTGTGIPENELAHVFERFHRVEGTRGRTYEGTGIGLSLVQELVKLHGGSIRVRSGLGTGSTFTVHIPFGIEHLPLDRIRVERTLASTSLRSEAYIEEALRWLPGTPSGDIASGLPSPEEVVLEPFRTETSRGSVLLADDNADMRQYVARLLSARYDVRTVSNGEEALQAVRERLPDLVLTDVMMPGLDGFALLRELRTDPHTRTIPVVLLSARAGEESRLEGLDAGADDYLVKPFTARELLGRVSSHLEMARLRREAMEALRRSEARLETELADIKLLQQVSEQLIEEENVEALYGKLMDAAVAIMRSEYASMQMLYPERGSGGELRLLAFRGFNPQAAKFWEWVRADSESTCGMALRTGKRAIAADVEKCDYMAGTRDLATYLQTGIHAVQTTPLFSRGGKMVGMISTHWRNPHQPTERDLRLLDIVARQAADLIERRQAEEAVRQRTAQFETLLNEAPLSVYVVDAEFRIRHVNPAALPVFGNIPDLIGRSFDEVMHILWPKEYADEVVRLFRRTLETGEPYVEPERIENRLDRGVTEYYEWQINRIPLPDGRYGVVCYCRDVSAQVKARAIIAESEERFRTLVSIITDVPWTTDAEGRFTAPQPAWTEYTGQTWEEQRGSGWVNALHPEDRERIQAAWEHACGERVLYRSQGRLWHAATKRYRYFEARATPVFDHDHNVREWVGTCIDVEDRKRAEDKLRQANADLEQFAYSAAHDLQEPLRQVSIYTELLQRKYGSQLDSHAREFMAFCRDGADRMENLIRDLLTYAKVASHPDESSEPANLSDILQSALGNLRVTIEESAAEIAHSELPTLAVAPVRIQQVFQNLIGNALKYRREDERPSVRISAEKQSAEWIFSIKDNGVGIAPQYRETVFRVFTRLEKRGRTGTGLGLAMCQKIVERYGGRIWVESELGKGSTFFFSLPVRLECQITDPKM